MDEFNSSGGKEQGSGGSGGSSEGGGNNYGPNNAGFDIKADLKNVAPRKKKKDKSG